MKHFTIFSKSKKVLKGEQEKQIEYGMTFYELEDGRWHVTFVNGKTMIFDVKPYFYCNCVVVRYDYDTTIYDDKGNKIFDLDVPGYTFANSFTVCNSEKDFMIVDTINYKVYIVKNYLGNREENYFEYELNDYFITEKEQEYHIFYVTKEATYYVVTPEFEVKKYDYIFQRNTETAPLVCKKFEGGVDFYNYSGEVCSYVSAVHVSEVHDFSIEENVYALSDDYRNFAYWFEKSNFITEFKYAEYFGAICYDLSVLSENDSDENDEASNIDPYGNPYVYALRERETGLIVLVNANGEYFPEKYKKIEESFFKANVGITDTYLFKVYTEEGRYKYLNAYGREVRNFK